jgi:hypothetical protein
MWWGFKVILYSSSSSPSTFLHLTYQSSIDDSMNQPLHLTDPLSIDNNSMNQPNQYMNMLYMNFVKHPERERERELIQRKLIVIQSKSQQSVA